MPYLLLGQNPQTVFFFFFFFFISTDSARVRESSSPRHPCSSPANAPAAGAAPGGGTGVRCSPGGGPALLGGREGGWWSWLPPRLGEAGYLLLPAALPCPAGSGTPGPLPAPPVAGPGEVRGSRRGRPAEPGLRQRRGLDGAGPGRAGRYRGRRLPLPGGESKAGAQA